MKNIKGIKILDYIRTTSGDLAQVIGIDNEYINTDIGKFHKDSIEDYNSVLTKVLKSGDYVNGSRLYVHADSLSLNGSVLQDNKIVQVITKEKFYHNCYSPRTGGQQIEWKPIKNFPLYQVSNTGSVMVEKTGKQLSCISDSKILSVRLDSVDGRRLRKSVAVLVLEAFVEDANGRIPVFIDGDKSNCNVLNLRWETKQEQVERVSIPQKTKRYRSKYKWIVGYYENKPVIHAENSRELISWLSTNCAEYSDVTSNKIIRSIVRGVPYNGVIYKCLPYEEYLDIVNTVKLDDFKELSKKIHDAENSRKEKKVVVEKVKEASVKKTTLDDIDDSEFYKEQERMEQIRRDKFKNELLKRLQGG